MTRSSEQRYTSGAERILSLHFGSLDPFLAYMQKHKVQEVCLKSVTSPATAVQGDIIRHFGVCISACLSNDPGTPIVYATFLAASGAWAGKHTRLLYPKVAPDDPFRLLPLTETIDGLQRSLFFTLQREVQTVSSLSVILDAQWDVQDVWKAIAKGFAWHQGEWCAMPPSSISLFPLS